MPMLVIAENFGNPLRVIEVPTELLTHEVLLDLANLAEHYQQTITPVDSHVCPTQEAVAQLIREINDDAEQICDECGQPFIYDQGVKRHVHPNGTIDHNLDADHYPTTDADPEHTCGGMYDISCEACQALRDEQAAARGPAAPEPRHEPDDRDVCGGL